MPNKKAAPSQKPLKSPNFTPHSFMPLGYSVFWMGVYECILLPIIKQYETYFEQQKANNQKVKPVPPPLTGFFAELHKQFEDFNGKERSANYRLRKAHYQEAKTVLDQIADSPRLSQKQFAPLLDRLVGSKGQGRLWHSGSLFRLRRKVYPHYQEFRELVQYIRQHRHAPAADVFSGAMQQVKAINGASMNYVAEIMMTYNPKQFANLNCTLPHSVSQ